MELWITWTVVAVALFVVEMVTPGTFFFLCFSVGALVAAALTYIGQPWWLAWIAFLIVSLGLVLAARPIVKRLVNGGTRPSNIDELIGQVAVVLKKIELHSGGVVKIRGEEWKAESNTAVEAGQTVEILRVDGTRLVVKPRAN